MHEVGSGLSVNDFKSQGILSGFSKLVQSAPKTISIQQQQHASSLVKIDICLVIFVLS